MKILKYISIILVILFIIMCIIDLINYNPLTTSAPFEVNILFRFVEFIPLSIILYVISKKFDR